MAVDVRERAEAVVLQLEDPVRMTERLADPDERHRRETGNIHGLSVAYENSARPGRSTRTLLQPGRRYTIQASTRRMAAHFLAGPGRNRERRRSRNGTDRVGGEGTMGM